ncbi:unnamed protein product [Urochloa humidicola]
MTMTFADSRRRRSCRRVSQRARPPTTRTRRSRQLAGTAAWPQGPDPPIPRQFPLHIPVNCNGIASVEFFLSGGSFLALPFVLDFFGFMSSDIPHHKFRSPVVRIGWQA